jgi:hypothetical protein
MIPPFGVNTGLFPVIRLTSFNSGMRLNRKRIENMKCRDFCIPIGARSFRHTTMAHPPFLSKCLSFLGQTAPDGQDRLLGVGFPPIIL